jgi:hypothetical protein
VVLQRAQSVAVEFRVAKNDASFIDERDAMAERLTSHVGETVGGLLSAPLRGDEACFPAESIHRLLDDACMHAAVDDENYRHDQYADDSECVEQESVRELHADLALPPRKRYPKPRTVSIRSPAGPSFARRRWMCMSTVRV